ncbi:hypothetical protein STIAU_8516 [Stigmatella aurantiaca DW4/3-1]|uniref:Uncharacterized protein n=1 Tax=Stigmatella aurantiaca (strain DW4/3-1) TaxID=378806 RepID=Q09AR2_STIAD|nr:hypothetical protein STIAU_8516 [Stigmatella aurantiaca DW4/3-1]
MPGRRHVRRGGEPRGAHRGAGPARHALRQRGGDEGARPASGPALAAQRAQGAAVARGGVSHRAARGPPPAGPLRPGPFAHRSAPRAGVAAAHGRCGRVPAHVRIHARRRLEEPFLLVAADLPRADPPRGAFPGGGGGAGHAGHRRTGGPLLAQWAPARAAARGTRYLGLAGHLRVPGGVVPRGPVVAPGARGPRLRALPGGRDALGLSAAAGEHVDGPACPEAGPGARPGRGREHRPHPGRVGRVPGPLRARGAVSLRALHPRGCLLRARRHPLRDVRGGAGRGGASLPGRGAGPAGAPGVDGGGEARAPRGPLRAALRPQSPRAFSWASKVGASVKRWPRMPSALAASTYSGRSSKKAASCGAQPARSRASWKKAGSGLTRPTSQLISSASKRWSRGNRGRR